MGCVLNLTKNDHEQLAKTVEMCRNVEGHLDKPMRKEIRATLHATTSPKLLSILEQPGSPAYNGLTELLAAAVFSKMSVAEKEQLPKAFHTILKYHPDAMGLFLKAPDHRAPGSSALQHHYEILSTAALIEKPQSFKTTSGHALYIDSLDRVDFGLKFSRGYAQPRRYGTIEADMLIRRGTLNPLSFNFNKTVAIDAKFSRKEIYSTITDLPRQLDGIRTGLRDGKVDEFYFVTNGIFSDPFKKAVDKENLLIAKDFIDNHRSIYSDIPKDYLIKEEMGTQSLEKVAPDFFLENNDAFKDFVSKHEIPQIELCQHVKYPGT